MSTVAVYNLKGGVGKTTAAVNLSYLSAAAGRRTLLWDLDLQGASSFAFRVRDSVTGFKRKSLEGGQALATAIKATDFDGLDLLPADFAYRKLDRLLDDLGKPQRVMTDLLDTLGRDYDAILLDCPPGFSLLTKGVFAASDLVLVPTIPTVLSLRTLARLIQWADREKRTPALTAFLSMVDRRKTIHRRACLWSAHHPELFLAAQIPYASVVEQMAVRRLPLPVFASADPATIAFQRVWTELQPRLHRLDATSTRVADSSTAVLQSIEALIDGFDSPDDSETTHPRSERAVPSSAPANAPQGDLQFVHSFDTDRGDLERGGYSVELCERLGSFLVTAERSTADREGGSDAPARVQAHVDARWAMQILSGTLSPLVALERRLGQPMPRLVGQLRGAVGDSVLRRVSSIATTGATRVA
jgi:chromosome partitioning protein